MKVLVAMNGGLKSLVTAWLLKKQGMQIRGVYFDWAGDEKSPEKVEALERKFGISIQVDHCAEIYKTVFSEAETLASRSGQIFNPKLFFHQSFLFPRLLQLKDQHGFDKVATGHRVLIHEDQVAGIFRVFQNADQDLKDILYLVGRSQKELSAMVLPLGSIPISMFGKLAKELDIPADTKATGEASSRRLELTGQNPDSPYEIQTVSGMPLGMFPSGKSPRPGAIFRVGEKQDLVYRVVDVNPERKMAWVLEEAELNVSEVHFYDSAWFSRKDLGLQPLTCGLTSPHHGKIISIRLLQYEGGRVKGFLNQPLLATDANIFKGQTMLWVEGTEILGGGRVLETR